MFPFPSFQHLNKMLGNLDRYSARVDEAVRAETEIAVSCMNRIAHLKGGCDETNPAYGAWRRTR